MACLQSQTSERVKTRETICGVGSQRLHALQKWAIFRASYASHAKHIANNILILYIFEKLMVLTLERFQTDFDLNNLVEVVVHCKNDVFERM